MESSEVQPPAPAKTNVTIYILSILLIFSLGTAGYFIYQNNRISKELAILKVTQNRPPAAPIVIIVTPTPEADPTVTWVTRQVKIDKISFSFKSPPKYFFSSSVLTNYDPQSVGTFGQPPAGDQGKCDFVASPKVPSPGYEIVDTQNLAASPEKIDKITERRIQPAPGPEINTTFTVGSGTRKLGVYCYGIWQNDISFVLNLIKSIELK